MQGTKALTVASFVLVGVAMVSTPIYAWSLRGVDKRAEQQYRKEKIKYVHTRDVYQNAREDYLKVRQDLKGYRGQDLKNLNLEKAKDYFIKVDQGMVQYLELVRTKVDKASGLSEAQKNNLLAEIDKDLSWLKTKQEEAGKVENKQELRALAKEVRDYWKESRKKVKGVIGKMMSYRVDHLIKRMEQIGEKVKENIDKLAADGKDVTDLEKWYATYQDRLAKAKEDYKTAKAKYDAVDNVAEGDQFLRTGNAYMKKVNGQLREAHKALKEIVLAMKNS